MVSQYATRQMLEPDAVKLLAQYSAPYPEHGFARTANEAVSIADRIGYPVVLKIVSPDVIHKSDAGGVVIGLETAQAVTAGFSQITSRVRERVPGAHIKGILVCKQAPAGLEVIVGGLHDPLLGPTVMFGLGGIFTELLKDVTFRIAPFHRRDAQEMIAEIRGYPLLTGARGEKPCYVEAVVRLLLGVSRLLSEHKEIAELDLNPVRVYERGLLVLDARIIPQSTSDDADVSVGTMGLVIRGD